MASRMTLLMLPPQQPLLATACSIKCVPVTKELVETQRSTLRRLSGFGIPIPALILENYHLPSNVQVVDKDKNA